MGRAKKNWMQDAVKKPGGLHKALHIKQDKTIPADKLEKATHSKNPHIKKMAALAKTFKKYRGK
jgi:hypothetical protein